MNLHVMISLYFFLNACTLASHEDFERTIPLFTPSFKFSLKQQNYFIYELILHSAVVTSLFYNQWKAILTCAAGWFCCMKEKCPLRILGLEQILVESRMSTC